MSALSTATLQHATTLRLSCMRCSAHMRVRSGCQPGLACVRFSNGNHTAFPSTQDAGYRYHRMDGSTSVIQRARLMDDFNDNDEVFVFLLTTKVGGIGVNLTGADRVLVYDPDWCVQCARALALCRQAQSTLRYAGALSSRRTRVDLLSSGCRHISVSMLAESVSLIAF